MMELDKKWLVLGDCAIGRRRILSLSSSRKILSFYFLSSNGGCRLIPQFFSYSGSSVPCAFVVRAKIKSRRDGSENEVVFGMASLKMRLSFVKSKLQRISRKIQVGRGRRGWDRKGWDEDRRSRLSMGRGNDEIRKGG